MSDVAFGVLVVWYVAVLLYEAARTIGHIDRPSRDLPCDTDGGEPCTGAVSSPGWRSSPRLSR